LVLPLALRLEQKKPRSPRLNELTEWKGAPWKWLFSNPKKTGYCDRWGYKLTLLTDKENARAVRYHVVKK